jgi:hypothetical protein
MMFVGGWVMDEKVFEKHLMTITTDEAQTHLRGLSSPFTAEFRR